MEAPQLSDDQSSWRKASIVSVTQFDESALSLLVQTADKMRKSHVDGEKLEHLRGKILGCIFFEPSTRTSCSFQAAMLRLGGSVITVDANTSSTMKGESLEDTVRTLECYCDAIVLRHHTPGAALRAARISPEIAVINAGDGVGEHPTQALLDLYTLVREFCTSQGLDISSNLDEILRHKKIALVGDLKHGRTVHSLAQLLALFQVELIYIAPASLGMPTELIDAIRVRNKAKQSTASSVTEVIREVDAVYVTRLQRERFEDLSTYNSFKGTYTIDHDVMQHAKPTCAVLHPLPRLDELPASFDADPRAAYFRQMRNGMFVRMALLHLVA